MNKLVLFFAAALSVAPALGEDELPGGIIYPIKPTDELAPESSLLAENQTVHDVVRDALYRSAFRELYDMVGTAFVGVRMIAMSETGSKPDYAVGLKAFMEFHDGNLLVEKFSVVSLALPQPLNVVLPQHLNHVDWDDLFDPQAAKTSMSVLQQSHAALTAGGHTLKPERCEVEIDLNLGWRLDQVWQDMLLRTGHSGSSAVQDPDLAKATGVLYRFSGGSFAGNHQYVRMAGRIEDPEAETKPGLLVAGALALHDYCRTKDKKYLTTVSQTLDELERRLGKTDARETGK